MKKMSQQNNRKIPARAFQYQGKANADLACEAVPLSRLVRAYGTPLYVYSANAIRERVELFAQAFAGVRHMLCYSVKANSNLAILRLLAGMGAGFDIVSGGELVRVQQAARKSVGRVVFSGVGKTAAEMDAALAANILVFNVESAPELDLLEARARHLRKRAPIALRVNPDVFAETHPYISTGLREHKFGVDMAQARILYRRAARSKYLEPTGISVHIGSQIQNAAPFGQALQRVRELVADLAAEGIRLRHIDAGGGLGISYKLDEPFDPPALLAQYAGAMRTALADFDGELLLEPGRFIIAQAGALVAQVLYVKQNGTKTFVVSDAGMNDLIRPSLYQAYHAIVPLHRQPREKMAAVDIVGPVCETGDFFARDRAMPQLAAGDGIAILDTGAYGMSLSSNYNSRPQAAEVLVDGSKHTLIRRRETMRDLLAAEKLR
ncbi:MAG TPA: diaminopimelate decarboxylase [Acidobacteriaceae bacterium]|jgi:diaminopimelate decarboxylase|nr:diaminopimelate decarboxylase [Acidobacteriaceae bacterium]